jgi:5''-3'' exonuclease (including N-terminal domain of PolI)
MQSRPLLPKRLATIDTDAPIQFDIKKCKCSDFDISALREAFLGQGFNTLTKRLDTIFGVSNPKVTEEPKEEKKSESDQLELL